jgi:hypothetical protein
MICTPRGVQRGVQSVRGASLMLCAKRFRLSQRCAKGFRLIARREQLGSTAHTKLKAPMQECCVWCYLRMLRVVVS